MVLTLNKGLRVKSRSKVKLKTRIRALKCDQAISIVKEVNGRLENLELSRNVFSLENCKGVVKRFRIWLVMEYIMDSQMLLSVKSQKCSSQQFRGALQLKQ